MSAEITNAIANLRAIEVERELSSGEERQLIALLRCRAEDEDSEVELNWELQP